MDRPLNDKVALRLDGVFESSDSLRDDVDLERYALNPTLTIASSLRTRITLGYEHLHDVRRLRPLLPELRAGCGHGGREPRGPHGLQQRHTAVFDQTDLAAAYFQDQLELSPRVQLVAGLRFDRFDVTYHNNRNGEPHSGLAVTSALYRLGRTNTRATDPDDPMRIVQTGSQRTSGFEVGITGCVTSAWRFAGGYAYQDAYVTSAIAARAATVDSC